MAGEHARIAGQPGLGSNPRGVAIAPPTGLVGLRLAPGTVADAVPIAALIASLRSRVTDHPDGIGAEGFLASVSAEAEAGYLASPRHAFLLAWHGDDLAGFIALRDGSHLFHLFVAEAWQGRGLAGWLWRTLRDAARQHDPALRFTVNASPDAVPVYVRWGFRAAGPEVAVDGIRFLPMTSAPADEAAAVPDPE